MATGLLQLRGSIALDQFWPTGRSDADTTKILLTVSPNAIEFRKNSSSPFHSTHVFDNAVVKGRTSKPPIKNGQVTIRLQGIDATELHYQPSPLSSAEKKRRALVKSVRTIRLHILIGNSLEQRLRKLFVISLRQPGRRP